jgi:cytochrome c peroxidase
MTRAMPLGGFSVARGAAALLGSLLISPCAAPTDAAPAGERRPSAAYQWHLPRGFPTPAVPIDNPMSGAKVALGRRLFFDPALSITGRYSCASCHDPVRSYSDGLAVAVGATGQSTPHSAMALVNVAYNVSYGWTTREVRSLESQMLQPLLNEHPIELGLKGREARVAAALREDAAYRAAFSVAFPGSDGRVTFDRLVKAIASFERTLISGHSPFDRYVFGGEHNALPPAAKRGMALFFSARLGCSGCHSGFNFAGNWRDAQGPTGEPSFANNGVGDEPMRVPTLRNIALTAPYMHDGRFSTLEAVLDHYVHAGRTAQSEGATRTPRLQSFTLDARERADLIAFLQSLTDPKFTTLP